MKGLKERHGRWAFLAVVTLFLASGFHRGCLSHRAELLRVGLLVWPPYEIPFLAEQLGYYEGKGIELVDFMSPADAVQAFEAGSVDAVCLTLDFALSGKSNGIASKIIIAVDRSLKGDAIVSRPPFDSLESLKGRSIGVEASPLGLFVLKSALQAHGMTMDDIEAVPVDLSEHVSTFETGSVDALVSYEPFVSNMVESGGIIVFDSSEMEHSIIDVLVASDEAVKKQNSQLSALVSGWFRAVEYYRKNPIKAAELVCARENLTPGQFVEAMTKVELFDLEKNVELYADEARTFRHLVNRHQEAMVEFELLPKPVSLDDFFRPEFVGRANSGELNVE